MAYLYEGAEKSGPLIVYTGIAPYILVWLCQVEQLCPIYFLPGTAALTDKLLYQCNQSRDP